jgi:hypothetical protein
MARTARIERQGVPVMPTVDRVRACLPSNYRVLYFDREKIYIRGKDNAMWTLTDVIDHLASWFVNAQEVPR